MNEPDQKMSALQSEKSRGKARNKTRQIRRRGSSNGFLKRELSLLASSAALFAVVIGTLCAIHLLVPLEKSTPDVAGLWQIEKVLLTVLFATLIFPHLVSLVTLVRSKGRSTSSENIRVNWNAHYHGRQEMARAVSRSFC